MKWIVRGSDDGVCHCVCDADAAVVRLPGGDQLDCPWCGCGWLFMCLECDQAFTYGRIAEVAISPTEIATRMVKSTFGSVDGRFDLVAACRNDIANQSSVLGDAGADVVVIDGRVLPLDYEMRSAGFIGRTGVHRLPRLPQFMTRDPQALVEAFARPYWKSLDQKLFA